jgi:hypothetical protein
MSESLQSTNVPGKIKLSWSMDADSKFVLDIAKEVCNHMRRSQAEEDRVSQFNREDFVPFIPRPINVEENIFSNCQQCPFLSQKPSCNIPKSRDDSTGCPFINSKCPMSDRINASMRDGYFCPFLNNNPNLVSGCPYMSKLEVKNHPSYKENAINMAKLRLSSDCRSNTSVPFNTSVHVSGPNWSEARKIIDKSHQDANIKNKSTTNTDQHGTNNKHSDNEEETSMGIQLLSLLVNNTKFLSDQKPVKDIIGEKVHSLFTTDDPTNPFFYLLNKTPNFIKLPETIQQIKQNLPVQNWVEMCERYPNALSFFSLLNGMVEVETPKCNTNNDIKNQFVNQCCSSNKEVKSEANSNLPINQPINQSDILYNNSKFTTRDGTTVETELNSPKDSDNRSSEDIHPVQSVNSIQKDIIVCDKGLAYYHTQQPDIQQSDIKSTKNNCTTGCKCVGNCKPDCTCGCKSYIPQSVIDYHNDVHWDDSYKHKPSYTDIKNTNDFSFDTICSAFMNNGKSLLEEVSKVDTSDCNMLKSVEKYADAIQKIFNIPKGTDESMSTDEILKNKESILKVINNYKSKISDSVLTKEVSKCKSDIEEAKKAGADQSVVDGLTTILSMLPHKNKNEILREDVGKTVDVKKEIFESKISTINATPEIQETKNLKKKKSKVTGPVGTDEWNKISIIKSGDKQSN